MNADMHVYSVWAGLTCPGCGAQITHGVRRADVYAGDMDIYSLPCGCHIISPHAKLDEPSIAMALLMTGS